MSTKQKVWMVFAIVAVVVSGVWLALTWTQPNAAFAAPEADTAAQWGEPLVVEDLGYSQIYQEGMPYSAHICGVFAPEDGKAKVYFTNDTSNADILMRLEVYDGDDTLVGETGTIRPGQYLQEVQIERDLKAGEPVVLKIVAYEDETYHSAGSVSLHTSVS